MASENPITERQAAQTWTYLAEGGNQLAHALISASSYSQALAWVREFGSQTASDQEFVAVVASQGGRSKVINRTMAAWKSRLQIYSQPSAATLARMGVQFVMPGDTHWPEGLNDLSQPALGLWVRGDIEVLSQPAISLVGSRAASAYGQRLARNLSADISDTHVVISGGAFGIDAQAHMGALNNGASTIIVSAGGVDRPYPSSHADLFTAAIAHGAVVSESALGAAPQRHRFLSRNRLIAALGAGTVVVEAPVRSGALSTARRAIDCGRPVGACPGSLETPLAAGCHALIRDGATLIRHSDDVRELISWQQLTLDGTDRPDIFTMPDDGYNPVQERVWEAVPLRSAAGLASIARVAGLSEMEVRSALATLELAGRVQQSPLGWYRGGK